MVKTMDNLAAVGGNAMGQEHVGKGIAYRLNIIPPTIPPPDTQHLGEGIDKAPFLA
jgi:hypothetical protein